MDAFGILLQKCWKSFGHWSAPRIRGSEMSLWTRSGTVCPPWHPSPVGNRSRGSAESGTYTTLPSRKVGNRLRVFREAAASPSVPDRGRGCGSGAVPPPPSPVPGLRGGSGVCSLNCSTSLYVSLSFCVRTPLPLLSYGWGGNDNTSRGSPHLRRGGGAGGRAGRPRGNHLPVPTPPWTPSPGRNGAGLGFPRPDPAGEGKGTAGAQPAPVPVPVGREAPSAASAGKVGPRMRSWNPAASSCKSR